MSHLVRADARHSHLQISLSDLVHINYGAQPCASISFWKPGYWVVSGFWWLKCWFTWTTWHGQQPDGILSKNTFSFSHGSMGGQSWLFNTQVWKCKHNCPLVNYLKKYMTCREIWLTQNTCFILLYIFLNNFHSDKYTASHAGDVARKVR